jgi:hypothetical protein
MALRERDPSVRPLTSIRDVFLPGARVYLDDLEKAFGWLAEVDADTYMATRAFDADSPEDLTEIADKKKELASVQIIAPNRMVWLSFRGGGLQPLLRWVAPASPATDRATNAIVGHWEAIRRPESLRWLLAAFWTVLLAIIVGVSIWVGAVPVGLVAGMFWFLAVVTTGTWRRENTKISLERRPEGPTLFERNTETLASNWLVIAVTLLLSIPITIAITVVLTK